MYVAYTALNLCACFTPLPVLMFPRVPVPFLSVPIGTKERFVGVMGYLIVVVPFVTRVETSCVYRTIYMYRLCTSGPTCTGLCTTCVQ
jgi:hypothetical protein